MPLDQRCPRPDVGATMTEEKNTSDFETCALALARLLREREAAQDGQTEAQSCARDGAQAALAAQAEAEAASAAAQAAAQAWRKAADAWARLVIVRDESIAATVALQSQVRHAKRRALKAAEDELKSGLLHGQKAPKFSRHQKRRITDLDQEHSDTRKTKLRRAIAARGGDVDRVANWTVRICNRVGAPYVDREFVTDKGKRCRSINEALVALSLPKAVPDAVDSAAAPAELRGCEALVAAKSASPDFIVPDDDGDAAMAELRGCGILECLRQGILGVDAGFQTSLP